MGTQENKLGAIVARAHTDEVFRKRLLNDPAAVLQAEGFEIPAGGTVKVVEDTATVRHLVLPPTGRLDDESLEAVAGGLWPACDPFHPYLSFQ